MRIFHKTKIKDFIKNLLCQKNHNFFLIQKKYRKISIIGEKRNPRKKTSKRKSLNNSDNNMKKIRIKKNVKFRKNL